MSPGCDIALRDHYQHLSKMSYSQFQNYLVKEIQNNESNSKYQNNYWLMTSQASILFCQVSNLHARRISYTNVYKDVTNTF